MPTERPRATRARVRLARRSARVRRHRLAGDLHPSGGRAGRRLGVDLGPGPRAVGGDGGGASPPGGQDRADRERELRLRGGARGAGLVAHEQVRRGPAGQALLRRLRVRGHRREPRPRPRAGAVPGRRPRQRPAALRGPGQHGGLLRRPQAGRPDPGHEPRPRRSPHPRLARELLGPPVRGARVRGHPRGRADRLRRPRGAGRRGPAQGHRRGGLRLSANVGLRAAGEDRPRRRRPPVRRHGPRRRARRRRVAPEPVPARRPRHHHHPQDAARAAWRRGVRSRGPARGRRSRRLPRARQEHAGAGRSTSPCSPASRAAR